MRQYITIAEAFGQNEKGEMDKRLLKAHPKTAKEKLSAPLSAAIFLASVYGGAKLGISWLDAKETAEQIFAAGIGGTVAALLGTVPMAITNHVLDTNKSRKAAKTKEIEEFITKNPNIKTDLDNFVKILISQTPQAILQKLEYMEHVDMFGKEPSDAYTDDDPKIKLAVKNLAKMISLYFDQQDEKWKKIAAKYNIDSPTLYQIWEHIGGINHIHGIGWEWEHGVKQMVSSPTNEETLEETSDEAIARIVELSKDRK